MAHGKHKHKPPEVGSIEWFFHNHEHGLNHCEGGAKNPYHIMHISKNGHMINKRYARGHGIKTEPQWFRFNKKAIKGWWDMSSAVEIDVSDVPSSFK